MCSGDDSAHYHCAVTHNSHCCCACNVCCCCPHCVHLQWARNSLRLCENYVTQDCLQRESADACINGLINTLLAQQSQPGKGSPNVAVAVAVPVAVIGACAGCLQVSARHKLAGRAHRHLFCLCLWSASHRQLSAMCMHIEVVVCLLLISISAPAPAARRRSYPLSLAPPRVWVWAFCSFIMYHWWCMHLSLAVLCLSVMCAAGLLAGLGFWLYRRRKRQAAAGFDAEKGVAVASKSSTAPHR